MNRASRNRSAAIWGCAAAAAGALWIFFSRWTATSWLSFPHFLVSVAILFVLPGRWVVRRLGLRGAFLEELLLSLVLGMVSTCLVYWLAFWLRIPWLAWLWVLAGAAAALPAARRLARREQMALPALRPAHGLLLAVLAAACLPMAALPFYYPNLARTPDGGLTFIGIRDLLLHSSVTGELTHTVPPQVPFLAGQPLAYHVGMDVVAAVLHRLGRVDLMDLLVRFCPTLFMTLAVLSVFCLARRFLGSERGAAAAAFLTVLGSDLSFVPGLLQGSPTIWCNYYLRVPTIFSMYYLNPMLLALGLVCTVFLCLRRSLDGAGAGWNWAAALCAAGLVQCKVFTFAHLVAALVVAAGIGCVVTRRWVLFRQMAAIAVVSLPVVVFTLVTVRATGGGAWQWSSGLEAYVARAFEAMKWPAVAGRLWLALPLYLVMAFGVGIAGIVDVARVFAAPGRAGLFPLILACFVVLGPAISLSASVLFAGVEGPYDNAVWFFVQSKYVAWLFAVAVLLRAWRKWGRAGRAGLALAVAALALPTTLQFFNVFANARRLEGQVPPAEAEAVRFLAGAAGAGDMVFARESAPLLVMTRLRVPYYPLYADSFMDAQASEALEADVERFWTSWENAGKIEEDVILKYGGSWVLVRRTQGEDAALAPSTAVAARVKMEQVFTNAEFAVFRVLRPGG